MELLFRKNIGPTSDDLSEIIRTVLRTIIQSHIKMEKDNPHAVSNIFSFKFYLKLKPLHTKGFLKWII